MENILPEVFELIVENLLDYEDPALVSVSNRHSVIQKLHFPYIFEPHLDSCIRQEKDNPPDVFGEEKESLELDPPNTLSGFKRSLIGYHNAIQLRLVSKKLKQKIDQIPFANVRRRIDNYFIEKISQQPNMDHICLELQSEVNIAELKSKWPRILKDYVNRSSTIKEEKQKLLTMMTNIYKSTTYGYMERYEDFNGEVYGKASFTELEFNVGADQVMLIKIKILHVWNVRESNWNTTVYINAVNKDNTSLMPHVREKNSRNLPPVTLLKFAKGRAMIDFVKWNRDLTTLVCKKLGLNESEWRTSRLFLEYFLLAAGEPKFIHFVPFSMAFDLDKYISEDGYYVDFERHQEVIDPMFEDHITAKLQHNNISEVAKEFRSQFLSGSSILLHPKSYERYLFNIRHQIAASYTMNQVQQNAKKLEISKYLTAISYAYDLDIKGGEIEHLQSCYIKIGVKTDEGGEFVIWALDKVGMGYHSPCEYMALIVMPLNHLSSKALDLQIGEQKPVYYHWNEKHLTTDKELCQKIFKHWKIGSKIKQDCSDYESSFDEEDDDSIYAKSPGLNPHPLWSTTTKEEERTFLTIFNEVLHIRHLTLKRIADMSGDKRYDSTNSGNAYGEVQSDWGIDMYEYYTSFYQKYETENGSPVYSGYIEDAYDYEDEEYYF